MHLIKERCFENKEYIQVEYTTLSVVAEAIK